MRAAAHTVGVARTVRQPFIGLSLWQRLFPALLSLIYSISLYFTYNIYLSPIWGYFGFPAYEASRSDFVLLTGFAAVMIFSLLLPPKIQSYSQFVCCVLFYFVFVPCMIIVPMQGLGESGNISLVVAMAISYAFIINIPAWLGPKKSQAAQFTQGRNRPGVLTQSSLRFDLGIFTVFGVIVAILLYVFGSSMSLISLAETTDLYQHRADLAQEASGIVGLAYVLSWFGRVICPFLIAFGLLERRWLHVGAGIVGLILVYAIIATKYIPVAILTMFLFYYWSFKRDHVSAFRIGATIVAGLVVALLLVLILGPRPGGLPDVIMSQALMRFYGNPGMQVGVYSEFVRVYGYTFYSHIGIVNSLIVDYPFQKPLGQMVGWFWANSFAYNSNASFWATDGVAAFGNWGVIFIGVIMGCYLTVVDHLLVKSDWKLASLSSLLSIWMLADASFFSFLLTGGAVIHIVLTIIHSKSKRIQANQMARPLPDVLRFMRRQ
jgi:hypothetical protein